jgi:hypothetical protein
MRCVLVVVACLSICGCAERLEKRCVVKGQVTRGGQPLSTSSQGRNEIWFTPAGVDGDLASTGFLATIDPSDGSYKQLGREGRGIPPGKYHVIVRQFDPYPMSDKLKGAFQKPSQIVVDVEDDCEFDVAVPES